MNRIVNGDSKLILYDWNNCTIFDILNCKDNDFDILNIPYMDGISYIDWKFLTEKYSITYYEDNNSSTGYSAIFINREFLKNRKNEKSKLK